VRPAEADVDGSAAERICAKCDLEAGELNLVRPPHFTSARECGHRGCAEIVASTGGPLDLS
jgi:hypothetical protein